MFLLQDWLGIYGNGTTPVRQSKAQWLELVPFSDVVLRLEVRSVGNPGAGNVMLSYDTSPALDETSFQAMASITLTASATPVITKIRLADNPAVPLARWLRWRLVGTASGDWSATVRIHVAAGRATTRFSTPTGLALTAWWRASYGGSPWVGTPSAGSSASVDLSEATNPPSVGSALNGHTPADFDGTNDKLTTATTLASLQGGDTYSGWALVFIDSIANNDTAGYTNDAIICAPANTTWYIYLRSSGLVGILHYDGAHKQAEAAFTTGAWHLVQWRHTGTDIQIRVDGGSWSSTAAGTNTLTAYPVAVGVGYDFAGPFFTDGKVAEIGLADSVFDDATFGNIKLYVNARYGLSL